MLQSTSVSIPVTASLAVGATTTLTTTILPTNATNQTVTWSDDGSGHATVDPVTGVITGVSAGDTVITVTAADGVHSATCTVTVS